jgi:hypothetical protein
MRHGWCADTIPGMRRWFSSDPHYGHANIIRFCDRPFDDVDHMASILVDAINATVPAGDELWLLGDLGLGPIERSLAVLRRIAADVVLVGGNHDRFHPYNGRKAEGWADRYLELTGAVRIEPLTSRRSRLRPQPSQSHRKAAPLASGSPARLLGRTVRLSRDRPR